MDTNSYTLTPNPDKPLAHHVALLIAQLGELLAEAAKDAAEETYGDPSPFDVDSTAENLLAGVKYYLVHHTPAPHQMTIPYAAHGVGAKCEASK